MKFSNKMETNIFIIMNKYIYFKMKCKHKKNKKQQRKYQKQKNKGYLEAFSRGFKMK